MMPSFRSFLLISLFLASLSAFAIAEPSYVEREKDKEALADLEAFQRLLDQVDPPALHAALHKHSPKKFEHGIFKEDRTAAEAVHREDASLATKIASLALAKRQNPGNGSSVVIVTTTSVAVVPITNSMTTIPSTESTVVPAPVGPGSSSVAEATPSAVPSPATTVSVGPSSVVVVPLSTSGTTILVTSTIGAGSSAAGAVSSATPSVPLGPGPVSLASSVSLTPGAVISVTNSVGSMFASTLTAGAIITTTNAAGVTIVTTINGGVVTLSGQTSAVSTNAPSVTSNAATRATTPATVRSQTSFIIQTTTLGNGAQSTITAVTVIQVSETGAVTPSGTAGVGTPSGTTTRASPGLQTGLAPRSRGWGWEAVGVLGGAIGVAMVI